MRVHRLNEWIRRRVTWPVALMLVVGLSGGALAEDEPAEGAAGDVYVQLEPNFTINYTDNNRLRYMTLAVSLAVGSNEAALDVNAHSDAIRHAIIMLVSAKTDDTFKTHEGREQLRQEILETVQALLEREVGEPLVTEVYITDMILQG